MEGPLVWIGAGYSLVVQFASDGQEYSSIEDGNE